jgi:hypothetical protein
MKPLRIDIYYEDNVATIYFIPARFEKDSHAEGFYGGSYLKKYFACEFSKTPQGWKMPYSFCFDATDVLFGGDEG